MAVLAVVPSPAITATPLYVIEDHLAALIETAELVGPEQEQEFRAVGSLQWRKVDLRIIAATHRNLSAEVAAGRFREDLYYRLNVFAIHLPPLRARREDLPLLIDHFLREAQGPGPQRFYPSQEIFRLLVTYDWPGNVRELKHCV